MTIDDQPSDHYLDQPCEDCGGHERVRPAHMARTTPLGTPTMLALRRLCFPCTQRRFDEFLGIQPTPEPSPLSNDGREEP